MENESLSPARRAFSAPRVKRDADELEAVRDDPNHWPSVLGKRIPSALTRTVTVFVALAVVAVLLRVFYSKYLFEDDGLWFTAGEEILRGKALYREIYFDKPPALALLYAGLFRIFGAHIIVIRLFAAMYSVATAGVIYLFGKWLYDRRSALLAAAMFTVFSTTFVTGHVQGFNTDFLMALPYTAAALLLARGGSGRARLAKGNNARWLALAGGALTGIASQANPKALLDLVFFAGLLILLQRRRADAANSAGPRRQPSPREAAGRASQSAGGAPQSALFLIALAGVGLGAAPFIAYIAATQSLTAYWLYVWDWGLRYSEYNSAAKALAPAVSQTVRYLALNNTLLMGFLFVAWRVIRQGRAKAQETDGATTALRADVMLVLWLATSYAGVAMGGRFYGHYFFQILPSLCLLGARGILGITRALNAATDAAPNEPGAARRARILRRLVFAVLAVGLAFTMVRFHWRTGEFALDWARGGNEEGDSGWFYERTNHDERAVAAAVREMPAGPEAADTMAAEAIRGDGPRVRPVAGAADYLFVWGYRPEIYYWSGLLPASRFLSSQQLTGVPADVHYFGEAYRVILNAETTAAARAELLQDLQQTRPKYIVDDLGQFNAHLAFACYSEFEALLRDYTRLKATPQYIIYVKRDSSKHALRGEEVEAE